MPADRDGTQGDAQQASLLDNEEDMDDRTHSELIQEEAERVPSPADAAAPEQEIANMTSDQNQQNDAGENDMTSNNGRTDGGKNQMMFVILVLIILVLVAVTVSQSIAPFLIKRYDVLPVSPLSQLILMFYMFIGFGIIVAAFICKHAVTEKSAEIMKRAVRDKIKYILRDYISIVGMSFFFPFACILDLTYVITIAGCIDVLRSCGDPFFSQQMVDMLYHMIHILFMGAELAFCCKFHGSRFKENGLVRGGIMIVLTANIGLWFLSLVYEEIGLKATPLLQHGMCLNESRQRDQTWQTCVHGNSSAHAVLGNMSGYLYPFAVEFSLLVGEVFLTTFVSTTQQKAGIHGKSPVTERCVDFARHPETRRNYLVVTQQPQTHVSNETQQLSTPGYQGFGQSNPASVPGHPRTQLGQVLSLFIIGIGLFASFLKICLVFIDSYAERKITETDSQNWGKVYEAYSIFNYMLINCLLVVGYACGYGFEVQEKKLHGLDWLVLISAFGPFVRELIIVTAVTIHYTELSAEFPAIYICHRLASWFQLILQAPFIFYSERWRLTERQRSQSRYLCQEKILKAIVFCLALANLIYWLSDSVILTDSSPIRKDSMNNTFSEGFETMEHIALPLLIFYRFNSFLLFMRAYLGD